jgi:Flp pilus assembly protein TadD
MARLTKAREMPALRDDIGVLYLELSRPAEAVRHFAATVRRKAASAPAHFNYGTALAPAGRVDEAVRACRALEIHPGYAVAHNNLGPPFSSWRSRRQHWSRFARRLASIPNWATHT